MSENLKKLCQGVEAISSGVEIRLIPSESERGKWSIVVAVRDAILIWTDFAPIDESVDKALSKLAAISTRMMAAVRRKSEPPSGSD